MQIRVVTPFLLALAILSGPAHGESTYVPALCADSYEKFMVREFYEKFRAGGPMPIASRELELVETKIVSGLPPSQSIGTVASRERFERIWQSIDSWGADNWINIVLTVDGHHAFNFPSKVPTTRQPAPEAFYSMWAEEGEGMHGHLNPDLMSLIYAVKIPAPDGSYLRAIAFYDRDGDLISGLYASEAGKARAEQVLQGFEETWSLIASMPRACRK